MASELHVDSIKHSGGTTAQTIDSTGRILTPSIQVHINLLHPFLEHTLSIHKLDYNRLIQRQTI
jgi:hypothetical protein